MGSRSKKKKKKKAELITAAEAHRCNSLNMKTMDRILWQHFPAWRLRLPDGCEQEKSWGGVNRQISTEDENAAEDVYPSCISDFMLLLSQVKWGIYIWISLDLTCYHLCIVVFKSRDEMRPLIFFSHSGRGWCSSGAQRLRSFNGLLGRNVPFQRRLFGAH